MRIVNLPVRGRCAPCRDAADHANPVPAVQTGSAPHLLCDGRTRFQRVRRTLQAARSLLKGAGTTRGIHVKSVSWLMVGRTLAVRPFLSRPTPPLQIHHRQGPPLAPLPYCAPILSSAISLSLTAMVPSVILWKPAYPCKSYFFLHGRQLDFKCQPFYLSGSE